MQANPASSGGTRLSRPAGMVAPVHQQGLPAVSGRAMTHSLPDWQSGQSEVSGESGAVMVTFIGTIASVQGVICPRKTLQVNGLRRRKRPVSGSG